MNSKEFIYVGNLPKNAREENIRDFFMPSGNALRIYFMRQSSPTKIAFLQFEDEDQAKDACVLDQTTFDNHRLTIMAADEEKFFYAKKTIIVRNILQDTTEEIIYDLFKSYGTIEYVQIPTAYYAYVGFKEESVAISAAADPNLSIRNNKLTLQILRRNIPIKLESLDSLRKDPNYTKDPPIRGQAQNQQRSWNEGQRRNENQQAESTKQDTRKPDRNENQFRNGNENQFDQKARVEESYQKRKPSSYEEKHSVVEKVAPRPPTITESITVEKTLTLIKPQVPHTSYDIEEKTKLLYSELNKLEAQKAKLQALLEKQSNVIETEKTEKQKQVFSEDVVMKDMETIVDLTVEHYTGDEVLSSEMTFTLPTDDDTGYKNCIFVDNIPREATEVEVIQYFEQFGKLHYSKMNMKKFYRDHVVLGNSALFHTFTLLMYYDEESVKKATRLFLHPFQNTKLVVIQRTRAIVYDPRKTIIIDPLHLYITYEDVCNRFKHVGEVICVKRRSIMMTAVAVIFRNQIDVARALNVQEIFSDKIKVFPYPKDCTPWFKNYHNNFTKKSNDLSLNPSKHPAIEAKRTRIAEIRMVQMENENLWETTLDIDYVVPDPKNYSHEVKMYNCPENVTFKDLTDYYERFAKVTNVRYAKSNYSNTWLVYASFKSLSDARKACKVRSVFMRNNCFKHLACEKVLYDRRYTVGVVSKIEMSEQQIFNGLITNGKIEFVIKEEKHLAAVIFQNKMSAKLAVEKIMLSGVAVRVYPYDGKQMFEENNIEPLSLQEMFALQNTLEGNLSFKGARKFKRETFAELVKKKKMKMARESIKNEEREGERQKESSARRDCNEPKLQNISLDEAVNMQLSGANTETAINNFLTSGTNSKDFRNEMNAAPTFINYNAPIEHQEDITPMMGQKFEMYARNPQACPPISTFLSIFNEAEDPSVRQDSAEILNENDVCSRRYRSRSRHRSPSPDLDMIERNIRRKEEAINRRLTALNDQINSRESIEKTDKRRQRSDSREFDDISCQKQLIQDELDHFQRKNVHNYPPCDRELYLVDKMCKLKQRQDELREIRRGRVSASRASPQVRSSSGGGNDAVNYRANRFEDNLLFVANLGIDVNQEDLKRIFERYGRIIRFTVTPIVHGSREAYIEYSRAEDAKKACLMNQVVYNNKRLRVSLNSNKPTNKEGYTICVRWERSSRVLEEDLYATFDHYGLIDFMCVSEETCSATVSFKLTEACDMAVLCTELVNGVKIGCRRY